MNYAVSVTPPNSKAPQPYRTGRQKVNNKRRTVRCVRCVSVNGKATDWFLLESSVPQGDILAPTAFILYIEALGILLRTDPDIRGLLLPSRAQLICVRFADDTGILVTPQSIAAAMACTYTE